MTPVEATALGPRLQWVRARPPLHERWKRGLAAPGQGSVQGSLPVATRETRPDNRDMASPLSLRLVLAPEADGDRIAGQLQDEHGHEHSFSSWLGLLSLLDAARVRTAPTPEPGRDRPRRSDE